MYLWTAGPFFKSVFSVFTWQSDGHAAALQQNDVNSATGGVEPSHGECCRLSLSQILIKAAPRRIGGEHIHGNCNEDAK